MQPDKISKDDLFTGEGLKFLRVALEEYIVQNSEEQDELAELIFSDDFKRNMNKIFREVVGSDKIPHPEVENNGE